MLLVSIFVFARADRSRRTCHIYTVVFTAPANCKLASEKNNLYVLVFFIVSVENAGNKRGTRTRAASESFACASLPYSHFK